MFRELAIKLAIFAPLVAYLTCSTLLAEEQPNATPSPIDSSDSFESMEEKGIQALVRNEPEEFKALLSPAVIRRTNKQLGDGAIDKIIRERFIPFFADFSKLEPNVTSTSTTDADGNKGLAYFRVFQTEEGDQKSFVIYVLKEGDKLVIGNVLINKTFREVTGSN